MAECQGVPPLPAAPSQHLRLLKQKHPRLLSSSGRFPTARGGGRVGGDVAPAKTQQFRPISAPVWGRPGLVGQEQEQQPPPWEKQESGEQKPGASSACEVQQAAKASTNRRALQEANGNNHLPKDGYHGGNGHLSSLPLERSQLRPVATPTTVCSARTPSSSNGTPFSSSDRRGFMMENDADGGGSQQSDEGTPPLDAEQQRLVVDDLLLGEDGFVSGEQMVSRKECPFCQRKFSAEAAARHIPKCKDIRSRPKPPPTNHVWYTDSLGVRHGSRGGLATTAKTTNPASNSPMNGGLFPPQKGRPSTPKNPDGPRPSRPESAARKQMEAEAGGIGAVEGGAATSGGSSPVEQILSKQWNQVQFLLKEGEKALTAGPTAMEKVYSECVRGLEFLKQLEEKAVKMNVLKGMLSKWLLPFNSNTDANDQANEKNLLGSPELDGRLDDADRKKMVGDALALRRFIRVKIADDADLEQAKAGLLLIMSFQRNLQQVQTSTGQSPAEILKYL